MLTNKDCLKRGCSYSISDHVIVHVSTCPLSPSYVEPPAASNVASFALAKADKGSKPAEHAVTDALDLARDWIRENARTPSHIIVFLARANEDGSDGIKYFQSGIYRSHAQVGMVIEGLEMMRGVGTYYEGD